MDSDFESEGGRALVEAASSFHPWDAMEQASDGPGGWRLQGINRRAKLRYSWREWLRRRLN
ncbi:MAG TPA: hypothetical protein VFW83_08785 [Bryobacteraceae bacterium]|nr:hypothetical protein [Bryobacteraceae bacterium]